MEPVLRREWAKTDYHPVGSCKMGNDDMAVVDQQLRARGMQCLRVVDASIMPTLISGNTQAPSIMIGEKGAHHIIDGAAAPDDGAVVEPGPNLGVAG